jgi:hypothetical protein
MGRLNQVEYHRGAGACRGQGAIRSLDLARGWRTEAGTKGKPLLMVSVLSCAMKCSWRQLVLWTPHLLLSGGEGMSYPLQHFLAPPAPAA